MNFILLNLAKKIIRGFLVIKLKGEVMNISKLSSAQSFCGTVRMDKEKIAKEIAKIYKNDSQEQVDSVIGNINTLKDRLEKQTPASSDFTLDLSVKQGYARFHNDVTDYDIAMGCREYSYEEHATELSVSVKSNNSNKMYWSNVSLGYCLNETHGLQNKTSGEEIWKQGFKRITEDILRDENMSHEEKVLNKDELSVFNRLA